MDSNDHDAEQKLKELREIAEAKIQEAKPSKSEAVDDSWMFKSEGASVEVNSAEAQERLSREGMEEHKMGREKVEAVAEVTEKILEHVQKATSTNQEAGTLVEAPVKLSPAENVDLATSVGILVPIAGKLAGELAYKAGKEMMDTAADLVDKAKEELKKRFGDRDVP